MKTFEEQFPSLKDKGVDSFEEENTDNVVETEEFWYPQEEIEKFCLDKQKVREAIEYQELDENGSLKKGIPKIYQHYLFKELGL